ncbi:MAG: copper resistance CopC family protein [Methylocystis sp.]
MCRAWRRASLRTAGIFLTLSLSAAHASFQSRSASVAPPNQARRLQVLAHAIVVRTSPAQDGTTSENIGKVEVWYDAGIRDDFAALAVISAAGERVDKRDAAIDKADPSHVSVSVNVLAPGKYKARYRAMSADGHLVSGAWDFEVPPKERLPRDTRGRGVSLSARIVSRGD